MCMSLRNRRTFIPLFFFVIFALIPRGQSQLLVFFLPALPPITWPSSTPFDVLIPSHITSVRNFFGLLPCRRFPLCSYFSDVHHCFSRHVHTHSVYALSFCRLFPSHLSFVFTRSVRKSIPSRHAAHPHWSSHSCDSRNVRRVFYLISFFRSDNLFAFGFYISRRRRWRRTTAAERAQAAGAPPVPEHHVPEDPDGRRRADQTAAGTAAKVPVRAVHAGRVPDRAANDADRRPVNTHGLLAAALPGVHVQQGHRLFLQTARR